MHPGHEKGPPCPLASGWLWGTGGLEERETGWPLPAFPDRSLGVGWVPLWVPQFPVPCLQAWGLPGVPCPAQLQNPLRGLGVRLPTASGGLGGTVPGGAPHQPPARPAGTHVGHAVLDLSTPYLRLELCEVQVGLALGSEREAGRGGQLGGRGPLLLRMETVSRHCSLCVERGPFQSPHLSFLLECSSS